MATVSRNFDRIGNAFKDAIVEDRDWRTVAALAIAGAGGAVGATALANGTLDVLGMSGQTGPWARVSSGAAKVLSGAVFALVGAAFGGPFVLAGAVAAIGAVIAGGGDVLAALFEVDLVDRLLPGGGGSSSMVGGPSAPSLQSGGSTAPTPSAASGGGGTTYR